MIKDILDNNNSVFHYEASMHAIRHAQGTKSISN